MYVGSDRDFKMQLQPTLFLPPGPWSYALRRGLMPGLNELVVPVRNQLQILFSGYRFLCSSYILSAFAS